jgi:hypothetical protein
LIFTDYAHQEEERAKWLRHHYRTIDGQDKCTYTQAPNGSMTDLQARHSPYRYPRTPQHLLPQARSLPGPPPAGTPRPPLQNTRNLEQWLPCPPQALDVPSQIPTPQLLRRNR